MPDRARRRVARGVFVVLAGLHAGACDLPKDPEATLERARASGLRVGVVESPPWVLRNGDEAAGPEAEIVRDFAASLGTGVRWSWGSLDEHLTALERFELDLVAAGLTTDSPWRDRVGFTRPWRVEGETEHVLAVPPGENRTLVALERRILARRPSPP